LKKEYSNDQMFNAIPCIASCQLGGYAPQVQKAKLCQAECAILLGARSAPKQSERKGSKGAVLGAWWSRRFLHQSLLGRVIGSAAP